MRCQDFDGLDIARFDVTLRALERTILPPFLGSTLRGALGHALKDAACVVEHGDCRRCPLLDTCAYPYLFETLVPPEIKELRGQTHAPLPFVIEPPLVENPVRRVWRVPAANVMAVASSTSSAIQSANPPVQFANSSQTKSPEANRRTNAEAALDTRGAVPQRQISEPASVVSSVVFPDRPKQFNIGDELRFGLVLIGRAIDYLPFFLHAISEMSHRGLGAGRAAFDLKEVFLKGAGCERDRVYSFEGIGLSLPARIGDPLSELIEARPASGGTRAEQTSADGGTPVHESIDKVIATTLSQLARPASQSVTNHFTRLAPEVDNHSSLTLRFLTPARIRVKDDLQTVLSFQLLVRSLLRRVSMLAAVHGSNRMQLDYRGLIERADSARVVRSTLRWWDLERYTDRQETKLRVGGLIGEVEYEGRVIDEFMPLICVGELLGVGTGTSLGLGRYQIRTGEERKL